MSYENKVLLNTRETSPVLTTDGGGDSYARGTKRGEAVEQSVNDFLYAIEGSYAILSNPTPGTAIVSQASITAYDATKDVLHILNSETTKALWIRYIKLLVGTVPGGSGTQKYELRVDTQTGYTSGGTALTAKRTNRAVASPLGNVTAFAGALTTVAGSSGIEKTYSGELRNGVGLAGDTFILSFGDVMHMSGFLLPATTVGMQRTLHHGPLCVPPGCSLRMSHYGASPSTAAQFEWEIGCYVR